jgi:hypothetical protein
MEWDAVAKAKNASRRLIPLRWQLNSAEVPSFANLPVVTDYICRFLDQREVEITNSPIKRKLDNACLSGLR